MKELLINIESSLYEGGYVYMSATSYFNGVVVGYTELTEEGHIIYDTIEGEFEGVAYIDSSDYDRVLYHDSSVDVIYTSGELEEEFYNGNISSEVI